MAYQKQEWRNGDPTTPLSAERLNHMEDGIGAAFDGGGTVEVAPELMAAATQTGLYRPMEVQTPGEARLRVWVQDPFTEEWGWHDVADTLVAFSQNFAYLQDMIEPLFSRLAAVEARLDALESA